MIDLTAIANLASQGFIVTVSANGSIEVKKNDDRRSSAAKRQESYRVRKACNGITNCNKGITNHNKASLSYAPLTWKEMPGKSGFAKKSNLSLLKRGLLAGYESCKGLEGALLRSEFERIRAARRVSVGHFTNQKIPHGGIALDDLKK